METSQQIVHTEIGKERGHEADDGHISRAPAFPAHDDSGMEIKGKDKPGDQAPSFFWVPAPIASPGLVSPDHAEDNSSQGEKRKADGDRAVADRIEPFS